MSERAVRFGIVGYGSGGRWFHAPFLRAAVGVDLVAVLARSTQKRAQVVEDLPGVQVVGSLPELAGLVDAVVITTPPSTRRELVLEALGLGLHVIADKPFAPDAATARELVAAAQAVGKVLTPYHNRRWDPDIRTVRGLLDRGAVGEVTRFESRLDLHEPQTVEGGPGGGVLSDLGSHLVDQALWLFGPVARVQAELQWVQTPHGRSDGGFDVVLRHRGGMVSRLTASKLGRAEGRELRLFGTAGAYRSLHGTDVLAQAVFAGGVPSDDPGWGVEDRALWGELITEAGAVPVPSVASSWHRYDEQFARAVRGTDVPPVTADEAVAVLEILDAARSSAERGVPVDL